MRSWLDAAGVYGDRRVASLFFFGFASGLPLPLTGATLAAWFTQAGASLTEIGLVGLIGFAYTLKYLWSPLVDRLPLPFLTSWLGRRRAWLLLSQITLIAALLGLASSDPTTLRTLTVLWAVLVAFSSATQDIAVDAYRTEILDDEQLGAGAATLVFGYRVAMVTSGGGALILAGTLGWDWAYSAMAVLMGVGVLAVLINPEPQTATAPSGADRTGSIGQMVSWFREAVVGPFADFMTRPGWIAVLLFVGLYKYGDALLGVMATPFYLKIGFSLAEIGVVSKGFGLAMTLAGAALGGVLVARYGIVRALLFAGFLQAASNLVFVAQALIGYSLPALVVTIGVENLTGGMGTTAFVAYLSSLCNRAYTATQYALLSSMMAATRTFLASGGGWVADQVDWVAYFLLSTAAAAPGLLLLLWMMKRYPEQDAN
jgi:PAT family beta-lactamase induction signal transducer AmpG